MTTYVRRSRRRTDIYTDGACSAIGRTGRGPGGWAWAYKRSDGSGLESWGHAEDTTNQRMEMTAVAEALFRVAPHQPVCIVTDSAYVMNCFVDRWHVGWKKRGWKKSDGNPVANADIWKILVPLVEYHDVTWRKVKGHSGDEMNDYVDQLAVLAKRSAA